MDKKSEKPLAAICEECMKKNEHVAMIGKTAEELYEKLVKHFTTVHSISKEEIVLNKHYYVSRMCDDDYRVAEQYGSTGEELYSYVMIYFPKYWRDWPPKKKNLTISK